MLQSEMRGRVYISRGKVGNYIKAPLYWMMGNMDALGV